MTVGDEDMWIAGDRVGAADGERMAVHDPATGATIGSVPVASAADLDRAVDAAVSAMAGWAAVDVWERSRVLRQVADGLRGRADDLAEVLTLEQGKPVAQARGEVLAAADQFDWYADEARRVYGRVVPARAADTRIFVTRGPVGPVAAFTPWNFPILLPARKVAPALAAGCAVVLKPAEETPFSALSLAEVCADAGLPEGLLSVVTGEPSMISAHLIAHDRIRKAAFTGSGAVGRIVAGLAGGHLKPVSLELGGHAPVLVFPGVDVERVATACAVSKFRNAGQVCVAPSRFFVHESIAGAFADAFVAQTDALRLGPGADPTADVGPLANARRVTAVEELVDDAIDGGACLRTGGRRVDRPGGFWFEPTVLTDVDDRMRLMVDEPFGPIAPIASFATTADAFAAANSVPYGLASYVFTHDLDVAFAASDALEAGMVAVNDLSVAATEAPFGGVKASGFGRENGVEGIDAYLTTKTTHLTTA